MSKLTGGRSDFREWVDQQLSPNWPPMPLTHITKALGAADIAKLGYVDISNCPVFNEVEDFCLDKDATRPNKLIAKVFGSRLAYFQGDIFAIP